MTPGPQATLETIKLALVRRPLWRARSAADFLDLELDQVMEQIQDERLAWAFNLGLGKHRTSPRVLSYCAVENRLGTIPAVGATKNLSLPAVINLVLPRRNVRSTELCRWFSCDQKLISLLKPHFRVTRPPRDAHGPHAYTIFDRASVARFLEQRRMK